MSVVLVMLDGVRPDALTNADCPHLTAFRQRGAYTLTATSVMPTMTLPCHMSIFHSVPPTRHGVTSNHWSPMARPLLGLVEQAQQAGKRSAFFYNWEPLRNLSQPGYLQHAYFSDTLFEPYGDHEMARQAVAYLTQKQPDFAFVYFGTVDEVGHAHGWMSPEYLAQLSRVDGAFGQLLDGLPAESSILVQSDHGGEGRNHGSDSAADMTIPWLVAGPFIKQNHAITRPVSLLDSAPTLAALLNVPPNPQWEGRCVTEIFV